MTPWERRAEILEEIGDPRFRELGSRVIFTERPECLSTQNRAKLDAWLVQRLRPNIEVPWLTIAIALKNVKEMLVDDVEDCESVDEVKVWLE